jgi:hypothetical protein
MEAAEATPVFRNVLPAIHARPEHGRRHANYSSRIATSFKGWVPALRILSAAENTRRADFPAIVYFTNFRKLRK